MLCWDFRNSSAPPAPASRHEDKKTTEDFASEETKEIGSGHDNVEEEKARPIGTVNE
jgi:hypothetical protein